MITNKRNAMPVMFDITAHCETSAHFKFSRRFHCRGMNFSLSNFRALFTLEAWNCLFSNFRALFAGLHFDSGFCL